MARFKRLHLQGADSSLAYIPPVYGKRTQDVYPDPPSSVLLIPVRRTVETTRNRRIILILCTSYAVDPTMLTPMSKLASKQAEPTSLIKPDLDRFL